MLELTKLNIGKSALFHILDDFERNKIDIESLVQFSFSFQNFTYHFTFEYIQGDKYKVENYNEKLILTESDCDC